MEIAHNDGDQTNCRSSNLRYDTPKGNNADKRKHGTLLFGAQAPSAKLTAKDVRRIRVLRANYTQYEVAVMYGVKRSTIQSIDKRKSWAHLA